MEISLARLNDLLIQYKQNQGYYDDYSDDAIRNHLRYSIIYAVNAGIPLEMIENSSAADGAVLRGAMDIWENGRLSRLTLMMISQLRGAKE